MQSSNSPTPKSPLDEERLRFARLTQILNHCIRPVTYNDDGVYPGDALSVARLIAKQETNPNDTTERRRLLEHFNPDNIIRLFFPNAKLSATDIDFLKRTKIIFRSEMGMFEYYHASHQKTKKRHEVATSLLGLFLIINYKIHARIISTPNRPDDKPPNDPTKFWGNIAIWNDPIINSLLDHDDKGNAIVHDYEIEIVPPQDSDLSWVNQKLSDITELAPYLVLEGIRLFEDTPHFFKLQEALRQKFSTLSDDIKTVTNEIYAALTKTPLSQTEILHALDDKPQLENVALTPMEQATQLIANFPSPFNQIFTVDGEVIRFNIDNFMADENFFNDIMEYKNSFNKETLTAYFNLFFLVTLLFYAKAKKEYIASQSQNEIYSGEKKLAPNTGIKKYIFGMLASLIHFENRDAILTGTKFIAFKIGVMTGNVPFADFQQLPVEIFNILFSCKDFPVLSSMLDLTGIDEIFTKRNSLEQLSTADLLKKLFSITPITSAQSVLVRKFARDAKDKTLSYQKLLKEFNLNQNSQVPTSLQIHPRTFLVPGLPINTYHGVWEESCGVVSLESKHILAFKRGAYSHQLNQRIHTFGFPNAALPLLVDGGKAYHTKQDFFTFLQLRNARKKLAFFDLNRKDFLRMCFLEFNPDYSVTIIYTPASNLKPEEISCIQAMQTPVKPTTEKYSYLLTNEPSDEFKQFSELLGYTLQKLKNTPIFRNTQDPHRIGSYYLSLLKEIYKEAVTTSKSLHEVLCIREIVSIKRKKNAIHCSKYNKDSKLTSPQIEELTTSKRSYARLSYDTINKSNEVLTQGARIISRKDQAEPLLVHTDIKNISEAALIVDILLKRHGNVVANFFNYKEDFSDVRKDHAIIDSMKIAAFLKHHYNQELPFIIYDNTLGQFEVIEYHEFFTRYAREHYKVTIDCSNPNFNAKDSEYYFNVTSPFSVANTSPVLPIPISTTTTTSTTLATPTVSNFYNNYEAKQFQECLLDAFQRDLQKQFINFGVKLAPGDKVKFEFNVVFSTSTLQKRFHCNKATTFRGEFSDEIFFYRTTDIFWNAITHKSGTSSISHLKNVFVDAIKQTKSKKSDNTEILVNNTNAWISDLLITDASYNIKFTHGEKERFGLTSHLYHDEMKNTWDVRYETLFSRLYYRIKTCIQEKITDKFATISANFKDSLLQLDLTLAIGFRLNSGLHVPNHSKQASFSLKIKIPDFDGVLMNKIDAEWIINNDLSIFYVLRRHLSLILNIVSKYITPAQIEKNFQLNCDVDSYGIFDSTGKILFQNNPHLDQQEQHNYQRHKIHYRNLFTTFINSATYSLCTALTEYLYSLSLADKIYIHGKLPHIGIKNFFQDQFIEWEAINIQLPQTHLFTKIINESLSPINHKRSDHLGKTFIDFLTVDRTKRPVDDASLLAIGAMEIDDLMILDEQNNIKFITQGSRFIKYLPQQIPPQTAITTAVPVGVPSIVIATASVTPTANVKRPRPTNTITTTTNSQTASVTNQGIFRSPTTTVFTNPNPNNSKDSSSHKKRKK